MCKISLCYDFNKNYKQQTKIQGRKPFLLLEKNCHRFHNQLCLRYQNVLQKAHRECYIQAGFWEKAQQRKNPSLHSDWFGSLVNFYAVLKR